MNCIQRKSKRIATLLLAFLLGVSALSSVAAEKPAAPTTASSLQFAVIGGKHAMRIAAATGTMRILVAVPLEEKNPKKTKQINAEIKLYKISDNGSKKKIDLKDDEIKKQTLKGGNRALYTVVVKNKDDLKMGSYEIQVTDPAANKSPNSTPAAKRIRLSPKR